MSPKSAAFKVALQNRARKVLPGTLIELTANENVPSVCATVGATPLTRLHRNWRIELNEIGTPNERVERFLGNEPCTTDALPLGVLTLETIIADVMSRWRLSYPFEGRDHYLDLEQMIEASCPGIVSACHYPGHVGINGQPDGGIDVDLRFGGEHAHLMATMIVGPVPSRARKIAYFRFDEYGEAHPVSAVPAAVAASGQAAAEAGDEWHAERGLDPAERARRAHIRLHRMGLARTCECSIPKDDCGLLKPSR